MATFTLRVPLAGVDSDVSASAAPASRPAETASLQGVRVLVVDDEEDARELLVTALLQLDADPLAVSSVTDAMAAIRAFRPEVIVSDIGMPVEDGYALLSRVRAMSTDRLGQVPVIALTAFAAARDEERAIAAGFSAYLAKPVEPARLVALVRRLASTRDE